jgi:hypothetical protein
VVEIRDCNICKTIGSNGEKEGFEKDGKKRCMRKGLVGEKGLVRQFPAIFSFIFYPLCAKHQTL